MTEKLTVAVEVRRILKAGGAMRTVLDELTELIAMYGYKRASSASGVGKKTKRDRLVVLAHCMKVLYEHGFKLQHLANLRAEHLRCIVDDFRQRGLMPATVAVYLSHLRSLCRWLQKPQLISELDNYVSQWPGLCARVGVATRDKSLSGAGVDPVEMLRKANGICPNFGCQLAIMYVTGARAAEAWQFRPWLSEARNGLIAIHWGTKGGRPRDVPVLGAPAARAVLEWAQRLVPNRSGWMIPPPYTLRKWRRRFYHLCNRIGLTRAQLRVTSHGFRHERMNGLYEWVTEVSSPVRGGELGRSNPTADRAARQIVANAAGHERVFSAGAYVGGMRRATSGTNQKPIAAPRSIQSAI